MFFALTDEQRALQESVREYLADRFPTSAVRQQVYDDPAGDGIPESLWQAFGEHGWLAVMVPEESDGLGLGVLDAVVLSRCLGAGVVPGPWLSTVVAGEALRLGGGGSAETAKWLGRIASGEVKLSFAPDLSLPVEYAAVADALVAVHDGTLTAAGARVVHGEPGGGAGPHDPAGARLGDGIRPRTRPVRHRPGARARDGAHGCRPRRDRA